MDNPPDPENRPSAAVQEAEATELPRRPLPWIAKTPQNV